MATTVIERCLIPGLCEHDSGWGMYDDGDDQQHPIDEQILIRHPSGEVVFGEAVDTPAIRLWIAAFLASLA